MILSAESLASLTVLNLLLEQIRVIPSKILTEILSEEIIFELLKKIAKSDKCVIVVSHSDNIIKYADHILYMKNGKLGVYNEGK